MNIYVLKNPSFKDFNEKSNDLMNIYFTKYYKIIKLGSDKSVEFIKNAKENDIIIIFYILRSEWKINILKYLINNKPKCKVIIRTNDFWHFSDKKNKIEKYYWNHIFNNVDNYKLIIFPNIKMLEDIRNINIKNNNIYTLPLWFVYKKAISEFNKNPINKILISGVISNSYPERLTLSKFNNINIYKYNVNDVKLNSNTFNLELNKYLACFTSSVYINKFNSSIKKSSNIALLKVFEILGSSSLLVYPKSEEKYIKDIGLFHKDNCWLIDFNKNLQEQINYILDDKNRKEIDEIRYRGWRHGIEKLNGYNKFLEFDNIIKNINNKYKLFNLNIINTINKPGTLVNIDINKINQHLKINFQATKTFYINNLNSKESRGNHANTNINELLICLSGNFEIKLFDGKIEEIIIVKENSGIYIPKNIWLEFYNFKNCVILAYTDVKDNQEKKSIYDKNEYIKVIST